jgi:diaminohydroxyphosphoribosylaminopyrimidine deaminase/5-amino-6-(5-phosphoribosylamino)uracil reductase
VEGGGELNAGFLAADLVDRVAVFVAPRLLGGATAPTLLGGPGRRLADAVALTRVTGRAVGSDWLIEADVSREEGAA